MYVKRTDKKRNPWFNQGFSFMLIRC
jgi:hypothetical protein